MAGTFSLAALFIHPPQAALILRRGPAAASARVFMVVWPRLAGWDGRSCLPWDLSRGAEIDAISTAGAQEAGRAPGLPLFLQLGN